jgi:iron complex outermembrane receptor protein
MNRRLLEILAGSSLLVLATAAQATPQADAAPAKAQAAPAVEVEVVVVTARRRDESIQDVPAVVNAVTPEELVKLNIRDFTEVQNLVPGLSLTNNANGIGGSAQVRGVNFDVNASGNNATVEFYQNDAPITAGVVLQQMYDVGQVEVLRGPQGTLRGRASPSGSITVTTKKPDLYKSGGYGSFTATDTGTTNFNGAVNIPIIEGIAAIRVAGVFNGDNANRVHPISDALDGRGPDGKTQSGRITALVRPVDAITLEGSFQQIVTHSRFFDQVESFNQVDPAAPGKLGDDPGQGSSQQSRNASPESPGIQDL